MDSRSSLQRVECTGHGGTPADLGAPVVSDTCDPSVSVSNDAPALFPLGQTIVTWTATDDSGNSSSPSDLWPPDHRMRDIAATIVVSDICDPNPVVRLAAAVSSEPDNGIGDGNTVDDIQGASIGTDDRSLQLRAERQGGGSGRIYTITYEAEDQSSNTTSEADTVTVPLNRSP